MTRIMAAAILGASFACAATSVRDFGAKGDGTTKDTAAIQRAIDAAAKRGGGTVAVPPGRYVSGTIHLIVGTAAVVPGPAGQRRSVGHVVAPGSDTGP